MHLAQRVEVHAGVGVGGWSDVPVYEALLGRGSFLAHRVLRVAEALVHPLLHRGRLGLAGDALLHQALSPERANRRMLRDIVVDGGLRIGRLVRLVMTVTPVSDKVDHHVVVVLRPIGHRKAHGRQARLRFVCVHVNDGEREPLGEVARIARRSAGLRQGREPDLVVDDDVHRSASSVACQAAEVERLGDHTLARERRVTVDVERHDARGVLSGVL